MGRNTNTDIRLNQNQRQVILTQERDGGEHSINEKLTRRKVKSRTIGSLQEKSLGIVGVRVSGKNLTGAISFEKGTTNGARPI